MHASASAALRLLPVLALAVPLAGALAPTATAQTVGARQRLVLRGGGVVAGTVVAADEASVVVEADGIRSDVPRGRIARIEDAGRFARVDPNGTRLFVTPTARTLPKGSVRLSTVYYVLPSIAYGATGNLDVSGAALVPLGEAGFVSGNVKYAPVQRNGLSVAVGAQTGALYGNGLSRGGLLGTVYGLATLGDVSRGVTVGAYGVFGKPVAGRAVGSALVGRGVGAVLGGEMQVSNSLKLLAENIVFVPTSKQVAGEAVAGIGSVGVRFFGERLSADAAVMLYDIDGGAPVFFPAQLVPLVTLSYAVR